MLSFLVGLVVGVFVLYGCTFVHIPLEFQYSQSV